MPTPKRAHKKSSVEEQLEQLQQLIRECTDLPPAVRQAVHEKIQEVTELVNAPPVSLADGGLDALTEAGLDGSTTAGDAATESAIPEFEPHERDYLEKQWMILCWFARHDMCEEEMLVLTEKTFRQFVHCYDHPNPNDVMRFWNYLVRLRRENIAIEPACKTNKTSSAPRERNAGDVVASSAFASQRTAALPTGVESGVYNPEVASPTAALWAKAPTERAASLRRSTEKAPSMVGSMRAQSAEASSPKASSPKPRAVSPHVGTPKNATGRDGSANRANSAAARGGSASARRAAGRLSGTDKPDGSAVVDTGDKHAMRKGPWKGFYNKSSWNFF